MDKSKGSCRPSNDPDLVKVDLKLLNHMIHDKNDMYNLLASKCGYILPSLTSKAITSEYLQGILTGKFWVMQYKEFNPYRWVALNTVKTKSSLIDTLAELIPKGKELGFDKVNTPDKKWLIDAIHSLKPDHHLFDGATHAAVNKSIKKAIRKEFELPEYLPPQVLTKNKRGFFKKTTDEKKEEEIVRIRARINRLQAREKLLAGQLERKAKAEALKKQFMPQYDSRSSLSTEQGQSVYSALSEQSQPITFNSKQNPIEIELNYQNKSTKQEGNNIKHLFNPQRF